MTAKADTANTDPFTERARAGWRGFIWFLGLSTAAIALALALMGLFLL